MMAHSLKGIVGEQAEEAPKRENKHRPKEAAKGDDKRTVMEPKLWLERC